MRALRSTHTRTSGGVSETEVKELAVMPCEAPEASRTVTTVMPLANLPQMRRNCCCSVRDKAGSGGGGLVVEFTKADVIRTPAQHSPKGFASALALAPVLSGRGRRMRLAPADISQEAQREAADIGRGRRQQPNQRLHRDNESPGDWKSVG